MGLLNGDYQHVVIYEYVLIGCRVDQDNLVRDVTILFCGGGGKWQLVAVLGECVWGGWQLVTVVVAGGGGGCGETAAPPP